MSSPRREKSLHRVAIPESRLEYRVRSRFHPRDLRSGSFINLVYVLFAATPRPKARRRDGRIPRAEIRRG